MIVMRVRLVRYLVCAFLPAALMLGTGAGVSAQDSHDHGGASMEAHPDQVRHLNWSDPAAWPDGRVPGAGDAVTIARDMDVVLDIDPPALRSLTIEGRLSFSDALDIGLETEWIYVRGGELAIGSEERPHTRTATITLTDTIPDENINTMGDRGIMLMGGTLSLHGNRTHTWSKLAATAQAGSTQITVLDASGWRAGDEIVLPDTGLSGVQRQLGTDGGMSLRTAELDESEQLRDTIKEMSAKSEK